MKVSRLLIPGVAAMALVFASCKKDEPAPVPDMEEPPVAPEPIAEAPIETPEMAPAAAPITFDPVFFDYDSYAVRADAQGSLRTLAESLKAQSVKVQIEGHCDERGSNEYNMALGERRAQAVKDFLVMEGVASENLSTISYGEEKPAAYGHDEESWGKNRRGEFVQIY